MLNLRYFRHTTWTEERGDKQVLLGFGNGDEPIIHLSLEPPGVAQINPARDYLHDVQLRQQVAVGQGELLAIQEGAGGGSVVVGAILVDLLGERAAEEVVQRFQSLQQTLLQVWERSHTHTHTQKDAKASACDQG